MNELNLLIFVIVFLVIGFILFGILIYKKVSNLNSENTSNKLLQDQINFLTQNVDSKLSETNSIILNQLKNSNEQIHTQSIANSELIRKMNDKSNELIQNFTEKLTKVEDTNKQVVDFAKQLQSLENILKSPKQRGLLGEFFLETLLSNVLPKNSYQLQYGFKDGVIVDAVIFAKEKIIPIDAKFPLEGYNRLVETKENSQIPILEKEFINDVKKRIEETSKYIKPEQNTIDVAFMFVPSEGVYQEIIKIGSRIDIISYAFAKHVVIVSPTSFFAYLQTLLQALNTLRVEEQIKDIIKYLSESTKYLKNFEEDINKLGKNLITTVNTFNRTNDNARKLSNRLVKITKNEDLTLEMEKIENLEIN